MEQFFGLRLNTETYSIRVCQLSPNLTLIRIHKMFERVVRSRIVGFLESHTLLNPDSHGLRCSSACLSQFLHHIDNILKALWTGSNYKVIYLDVSKVFDRVDQKIRLSKLAYFLIHEKLLHCIEGFLVNREQHVVVNGIYSGSINVTSGGPQETVLGLLLFLI